MKRRLISTLVLLSLLALGFTASANAQKPIPGIKKTSEYRELHRFVNVLRAKRNQPVSNPHRATFRVKLKDKQAAAVNRRQANRAYLRLFRSAISAAKQRKVAEIGIVSALRDRGIDDIPTKDPPSGGPF